MKKNSADFSDFIRNAEGEEREEVFLRVMDRAATAQKEWGEDVLNYSSEYRPSGKPLPVEREKIFERVRRKWRKAFAMLAKS